MPVLEGRRVLVTGAGSGIGRATAMLFAEEGAKVALLDIDNDSVSYASDLGGVALSADAGRIFRSEE